VAVVAEAFDDDGDLGFRLSTLRLAGTGGWRATTGGESEPVAGRPIFGVRWPGMGKKNRLASEPVMSLRRP
jgi:hypothetical protein